jgi:hypothetical protein
MAEANFEDEFRSTFIVIFCLLIGYLEVRFCLGVFATLEENSGEQVHRSYHIFAAKFFFENGSGQISSPLQLLFGV